MILVYVNKGESADTKIGDHRYIAPEVISDDKYTKEIDTYSLGVLLHYLIMVIYKILKIISRQIFFNFQ